MEDCCCAGAGDVFSEAELDLAEEFMSMARAGLNPSVEEFLARAPDSAERLRPVLEGAELMSDVARQWRVTHQPGDALALLRRATNRRG